MEKTKDQNFETIKKGESKLYININKMNALSHIRHTHIYPKHLLFATLSCTYYICSVCKCQLHNKYCNVQCVLCKLPQ